MSLGSGSPILATLTMRLLNATLNSDRIPQRHAREFQSFLAGTKDRALYAGQPRGVRLIQDPNRATRPRHSFVYIGRTVEILPTVKPLTIVSEGPEYHHLRCGTRYNRASPGQGLVHSGATTRMVQYITLGTGASAVTYSMARNPLGSTNLGLDDDGDPRPNSHFLHPATASHGPLRGECHGRCHRILRSIWTTVFLPSDLGSPGAYGPSPSTSSARVTER